MTAKSETPVSDAAMERLSVNHTHQWPKLVELQTAQDLEREAHAWRERFGKAAREPGKLHSQVQALPDRPGMVDVRVAQDLEREVIDWRQRFPEHTYRRQDDCVSLRLVPAQQGGQAERGT